MRRKIVVYDYSSVAKELLLKLKFGHDEIVLVTKDEYGFAQATKDGFHPVLMDLSDDENLLKIGVASSVTDFFCVSDDDDINLYTTLSARAVNANLNILARASDADSKKKLILAGANETIDFNEIGANRAFHLLKRATALGLIDSIVYSKGDIIIAEIDVSEGSAVDKKYFFDLDIKNRFDIIVLGLQDNQISKRFIFNVNSFNHKIDAGDVLVVIGKSEEIQKFAKECGAKYGK